MGSNPTLRPHNGTRQLDRDLHRAQLGAEEARVARSSTTELSPSAAPISARSLLARAIGAPCPKEVRMPAHLSLVPNPDRPADAAKWWEGLDIDTRKTVDEVIMQVARKLADGHHDQLELVSEANALLLEEPDVRK